MYSQQTWGTHAQLSDVVLEANALPRCISRAEAEFGAALTLPRQSALHQLFCLGLIASNLLPWQYAL